MRVLGRARLLVGLYLALSVATLVVAALLRGHHDLVDDSVWVRGGIVAATAVLMFAFASRATHGSRGGWVRLRVMSAVMLVAIVVIVAVPGSFPMWLKSEQVVCGLLLAGVVVLANSAPARRHFSPRT